MADNGESWVKEFTKCPQCGSGRRMFEEMGKELIERGLCPADMKFYYDTRSAPLANQAIMAKLPIGAEILAFGVATDFCLDCGAVYAVRLEQGVAKKGLAPVQFMPNREQRRAGMQPGPGFRLPGVN